MATTISPSYCYRIDSSGSNWVPCTTSVDHVQDALTWALLVLGVTFIALLILVVAWEFVSGRLDRRWVREQVYGRESWDSHE